MSLLTNELRAQLPPLYSQADESNPTIFIKFFLPGTRWTWYISEGEPKGDDFILFGFTFGQEAEWGYSMLSELESVHNKLGLPVERDLTFTPAPWQEVQQHHFQEHGSR